MVNSNDKCREIAKVIVPWNGKLLCYCAVHANQLVRLAECLGCPVEVRLLSSLEQIECESVRVLTDEEKRMDKSFEL